MRRKIISLLLIIAVVLNLPTVIYAQTAEEVTWSYLKPQSITGADDLRAKADLEANNIISAGHLRPLRNLYGEIKVHFFFYKPYETIYTLSLLYPFVNSSTQTAIKNYLKTEMQTYPVWYSNPTDYWGSALLPPHIGTPREPDILPAGIHKAGFDAQAWNKKDEPQLFGLYALWLYANNTRDWQYIETNWNSIKSFYNNRKAESSQHYSSLAGAIGMARMAYEKPTRDTAIQTDALAVIGTGLTNSKNYTQMAANTELRYKFDTDYPWNPGSLFPGFHLVDITPEIGKIFNSDTGLKDAVIGNTTSNYSLKSGESLNPLWNMRMRPVSSLYYGESMSGPPNVKAMLFPIHNWVLKSGPAKLRTLLDVPEVQLGDYYYIQNVTRAIESSGTECWENIQTTTLECPAPLFAEGGASPLPSASVMPSVAPSPSPSVSPSPAPVKQGDIDGNNKVDIFDYNILLTNFGKTGTGIPGDLNGSGKVDIFDYNILLTNFGK